MLLGEIDNMIATGGNRRHLGVEPVDPAVGVHVQLGDEAAPDETHSYLGHRARSLPEDHRWERTVTSDSGRSAQRSQWPARTQVEELDAIRAGRRIGNSVRTQRRTSSRK